MNIPITKPFFDDAEKEAIVQPLETGWVVQGPNVHKFETLFAEYSGARFARATTSCTTALHMALAALGIGPSDEVILPAFTFIASANAVEYLGGRPVFVDIDLDTFNIDVTQIAPAITRRTRAIMPVSLFGLSADMDPILELAHQHKLGVVEDAACAIGALYKGVHAGTLADMSCFSLHPRKLITTGEGGMLVTDSEELVETIEAMRSHGGTISDLERHRKGSFALPEHNLLGYNYRMTDLQGAVGVAQMGKLDWIVERRSQLAQRYDNAFAGLEAVATPFVPAGYRHAYQSYVLFIQAHASRSRDELAVALLHRGVSVRQGTHAVHIQGYYRDKYGLEPGDFPKSFAADRQSLALPLFQTMVEDEQEYVIEQVQKLVP
jgi:dTDP-4-amino-4,6-dideoxygalactose transaminase